MEIHSENIGGPTMAERQRAVRILAKSIFKELTSQGYSQQQIVSLATELISAVTDDISQSPASVR